MDGDRRRIELMTGLLMSLPGSPILYYGDEIGMGDNVYLGDRNGVRTPMQWSVDRNAGFSKADPAQLCFPLNMDPVYGYQAVNVEAQQRHSTSLLHWMRQMIMMRKSIMSSAAGRSNSCTRRTGRFWPSRGVTRTRRCSASTTSPGRRSLSCWI